MEHPGFRATFYALTALSLAIMAWQFVGPARKWMQGKPLNWRPDYLKGVITNVLGQKKVQGSRPRSGAPMHLMIFYGFLSMLLATTLLAIATYSPVVGIANFHRGAYYIIFEAVFDLLGLLLVFGLTWAIVRRFKVRHELKDKNPVTTETKDFIALIILLGLSLTGYLVEAARIANNPQEWDWCSPVGYSLSRLLPGLPDGAYIGIWWFHFGWVFAFFALLPQMRLRHIVTATLSSAGSPERPMGELVPVSMEQVESTGMIGAANATDFTRWHLLSLDACMECGRCTEVCPAYNVGKSLNPKKIVADMKRAHDTGAEVAATLTDEALWACTTCHACVEACPVLIRHTDFIVDARRHLVAEGRFAGSAAVMLRQVGSTQNAWGAAASSREDWMKGLDVPLARDKGQFDVLFWVGCAGATDPGAIKTTKAVAKLLAKAGVDFACLGQEEACTGDPPRRVGDEFTFQAMAESNVAMFRKYGVQRVVTACPHCLNTLKNEYHQFGGSLEVYHHTQFLAKLVDEGQLKPAELDPGSTVYHDPCYLARVNGESDAPRRLVGESTSLNTDGPALFHALTREHDQNKVLAEPVQFANKTLCCGAGGGRMWMEEEPGHRPSERRVQQLLETGATQVAVSCPFCRIMLDAGLKQADETIRLIDMAELLQDANS